MMSETGRFVPRAVGGGDAFHFSHVLGPCDVAFGEFDELAETFGFGGAAQDQTLEIEIVKGMGELKAEQGMIWRGVGIVGVAAGGVKRGTDLAETGDGFIAQMRSDRREIVIVEVFDFAAQPVEALVDRANQETPVAARQDVEASIGVAFENRLDHHSAACVHDTAILCKDDAKLSAVSLAIAHHGLIAFFKDVERNGGPRKRDDLQGEQREQSGHYLSIPRDGAWIRVLLSGPDLSAFKSKVYIVTGASDGIGARLARALRGRGARLVLSGRDEARLRAGTSAEDLVVAGDITVEATRVALVEKAIERFGQIDGLINNAGRGSYYAASKAPLDDARSLFELNFFAPLHLAQLAAPWLVTSRGSLVNIGSIASQVSLPWLPIYSASKFALASLTQTQRMELRRSGVHVMAVYPGYVDTAFQAHAAGSSPPREIVNGRRFAVSAEECAAAVVRGLERRSRVVVTPRIGWVLIWLNRLFPRLVESRMDLG